MNDFTNRNNRLVIEAKSAPTALSGSAPRYNTIQPVLAITNLDQRGGLC